MGVRATASPGQTSPQSVLGPPATPGAAAAPAGPGSPAQLSVEPRLQYNNQTQSGPLSLVQECRGSALIGRELP